MQTTCSPLQHENSEFMLQHFYQHGWCWIEHFLPEALNQDLLTEATSSMQLMPAGVGRNTGFQLNQQIRRDYICWLGGETLAQQAYLQQMQLLQQQFNRHFMLGLFDFECHFARYQQGDFYQKHLDAFKGRSNRVLTTVSYLNTVKQGGELLLYNEQEQLIRSFSPTAGSLLLFESERFPHEVLPAADTRYSIAGWFRRNNSVNGVLDPAG